MKRKAPSTEFKPPQQRSVKLSRQNSTENTTSDATELQPAEGNQNADIHSASVNSEEPEGASLQCTEWAVEKYLHANKQEIDSSPVETTFNVEHAGMIITESAQFCDIKYKPQSESPLEYAPDDTSTEGENEAKEACSPEPQTFHVAHSSLNPQCPRYSLDETGEDKPCGATEESKTKVLDPEANCIHGEGATVVLFDENLSTGATGLQATDEPPPKRRLRRRMGMCGLGDKKRRSILDGQHCRQSLNGREKEELGKAAVEESRDVLRNSSVVEKCDSSFTDEGMTEQVVLQQGHSLQLMTSEEALITVRDVNEVRDQLCRGAMTIEHDMEMATSEGGPDLAGNGANTEGQDMEDVTESPPAVAKEISEGVVAEEMSHGSVTDEVCEGSKKTSECPVAIVEIVSFTTIGLNTEVYEGFKETAAHKVTEAVSSGLLGVTNEVCEGSNETSECLVEVAEEVSCGAVGFSDEVYDDSKEPSEEPPAAEVRYGSTDVTNEVCQGYEESIQAQAEAKGAVSYGSVGVCENSKENTEGPLGMEANYSSTDATDVIFEGSNEANEGTVDVVEEACGSTGTIDEVLKKEAAELLVEVAEEVKNSSTAVTDDISEGSKKASEGPVEAFGSTGITDEVYKKEAAELLVESAEEMNNSFAVATYKICEGPKEAAELSVEVSEGVNNGSVFATEVCGGSEALNEGLVEISVDVSCGSVGVAGEVPEGSVMVNMEVQESITALEQSELETEEKRPPHDATSEHNLHGPGLGVPTGVEMKTVFIEHMVTAAAVSMEFPEIHATKSQREHTELSQTPTTAVPVSRGPGEKSISGTDELTVPEAPPTGQEDHMHLVSWQHLPDQCARDPSVIPAVVKCPPDTNPTLSSADTEFPQDHDNIPLSLYSVTDSQLNTIAISMELDDQPVPEGTVHQEDATGFICGLIKELSSLNRTVMVAHREMELVRRGNRPPKAPVRRTYGLRNAEI